MEKLIINQYLSSLWQLPQHLLALLLRRILKPQESSIYKCATVYLLERNLNFSLGHYIFIYKDHAENTLLHEYGHTLQSHMFGPLYLLAIGVPSLCRFIYCKVNNKSHEWYHSGYPERWADKLGKIIEK